MNAVKKWVGLITISILLMYVNVAWADIAPPEKPPGGNVEPAQQTKVQMVAEHVLIDVTRLNQLDYVRVSAVFTMHNTSAVDETMLVRFPLSDPDAGDGHGDYPQVKNFSAYLDDHQVATQVISEDSAPWAVFKVTFPTQQDVLIKVSYVTSPTMYGAEARLFYILRTGAGWYGPIGQADVVLRLPYPASQENILSFPDGTEFINNEVRSHWENLEPGDLHNTLNNPVDWRAEIIDPHLWKVVLNARAQVKANPNNAQAFIDLADAYQAAATDIKHWPNNRFKEAILHASEQAVILKPNSAKTHALLAESIWWINFSTGDWSPDGLAMQRAFQELSLGATLDPNDKQVKQVFKWFSVLYGGEDGSSFVLPTLGPLPTVTLTPLPTSSRTPTLKPTRRPSATPTPTLTQAPLPSPSATRPPVFSTPPVASTVSSTSASEQIIWVMVFLLSVVVTVFALSFNRK